MNPLALMYVAFGGAAGSMARYAVMTLVGKLNTSAFPFGTFAVNILGSFIMGIWIGLMATMLPSRSKDLHLIFAVGFLGGFTTFSTFTVDAFLLIERGLAVHAIAYIFGSVFISLLAFLAGMWLIRMVA